MAQTKRPITPEDIANVAVLSDPMLTPDGSAFTYVTTSINEDNEYQSNITLHSLDGGTEKQWTYGTDRNASPRFSPDGKKIVYQSDKSGTQQLWLAAADGGEAKQITHFKNGASNPAWAKDGSFLVFSASLEADDDVNNQEEQTDEDRKKEQEEKNKKPLVINRLAYKSDAAGFLDNTHAHIILYNLEHGTFTKLTTEEADHNLEDISPDSKQLLFSANLSEDSDYEMTNDLYLLDIATQETTVLTDGNGAYGAARFSPDGGYVAAYGHELEYAGATLNELFLFDIATKKRTQLSDRWDITLGDAMIGDMRLGKSTTGPVWSHDGKTIYLIATSHGATGLYQVSMKGKLQEIYKADSHIFGFSHDDASGNFILGISTPTDPGEFYRLDKKGKLQRLTDNNDRFIKDVHVEEPEELTITADDGWKIQGWLLKPYGFEKGKKYPFILEVHGGPHAMYGQTFFHELQLLAAKGYVVLYTNPRGSHGYGQAFVDACRSDYGGKDYTDLMNAVDHVLKKYSFIDKERLGVTGGSYGGFMTNWIVGHTNRFKAAVTQRCISNWLSFYGVSDIGYFFTKWELGHNLLEDPEKLWDFSPLKYAADIETPLLIVHGEKDYRCPIEQGEQMYVALKHQKKETEFVRFPEASHELSRSGKPEMRIERLNHICRWFEQYL